MKNIKIIQELVVGDSTLIFTENPEQDVKEIQEKYRDDNRIGYMGYELPALVDFKFLGKNYKAISFWHDNEDIRDIDL